jgi:hypothetical protein
LEDNVKIDLREMGWGVVDWINLAEDRDQWRALANAVLNLQVPWNVGKFLSSWATGDFSRAGLQGVSYFIDRPFSWPLIASKFQTSNIYYAELRLGSVKWPGTRGLVNGCCNPPSSGYNMCENWEEKIPRDLTSSIVAADNSVEE